MPLIIPSNAVALPTSPHRVRNTVYSTDPRIVLAPKSSCTGVPDFDGCGKRYDPWDLETYTDSDGERHSFYLTISRGNYTESADQIRGMSFGFRGTSLEVYGAPYRQIQELGHVPGKQELCLLGDCQEVNAQAIYNATNEAERDSPVLLWSYDGLPDNRYHRLELRLLDISRGQEQPQAMTIHHIVYKSRPSVLPPRYQPSSQELLVPTTYYDTNPWISFCSGRRSRYDPWWKEVIAMPSGQQRSFHHTSSWKHDPSGPNARLISFKFQGVALYVYGASPAELTYVANGTYEHAHQEICIDSECEAIDTHQLYLNIETSHAHEPVLLWSHEGYPSAILRHVQLRLLDEHLPVKHIRRMTLSQFVVTEVKKRSLWTHPIANVSYSDMTISPLSSLLRYSPRPDYVHGDRDHPYSSWDRQAYSAPDGQLQTYIRTSTWDHVPNTRQRAWQFFFTGHEIRVYGAPRPYLVHPTHAKVEACLDDDCRPVDVEHAYLNVDPDVERKPVLLWSMEDIDVSRPHTLAMRMIESEMEAGSEIKGMTFAGLEYTKVEFPIDAWVFDLFVPWWTFILPLALAVVGVVFCCRRTRSVPTASEHGSNTPILSTRQRSYNSTSISHRRSPSASTEPPGTIKFDRSSIYTSIAAIATAHRLPTKFTPSTTHTPVSKHEAISGTSPMLLPSLSPLAPRVRPSLRTSVSSYIWYPSNTTPLA
ncbi:hypothetical protein FRB94_011162 [Tulasnella sp. JGI-2019a]|nr:hypothetical protein FRB94_011162 [Tulasnella sp. JGI-2019a]